MKINGKHPVLSVYSESTGTTKGNMEMATKNIHMVTGAFGYSGKYIAKRLLEKGLKVITITNSPNRKSKNETGLEAYEFNFDNPDILTETLKNVKVLYNTYWVRFNHKDFAHNIAVKNTQTLIKCAKKAGVERFVHVSITNPSETSHLEYFSGKDILEKSLKKSGLSYAILRPTVLFGKEDILINNIAWLLRTFPIFGIFGDGKYKLQPIYVDDLAKLAVEQGNKTENTCINAIGPETFTYYDLVKTIGEIIGKKRTIIKLYPAIALMFAKIVGLIKKDKIITKEEIEGLMSNLLFVNDTPTGFTKLTDWVLENKNTLGRKYTSEIERRRDRIKEYESN